MKKEAAGTHEQKRRMMAEQRLLDDAARVYTIEFDEGSIYISRCGAAIYAVDVFPFRCLSVFGLDCRKTWFGDYSPEAGWHYQSPERWRTE